MNTTNQQLEISRCPWVSHDPIYQDYHDKEWGIPQFDNLKLFEQLCLEGQQAGLSWITVLKKRENYRQAFFYFDPVKIAQMTEDDVEILLQNKGLIRHRGKLTAIIDNAKAYLSMQKLAEQQAEDASKCGPFFADFIWSFVNHQIQNHSIQMNSDIPNTFEPAKNLSKALKKRGFRFVGETTCYAFMQACGLVNDHFNHCAYKHYSAHI